MVVEVLCKGDPLEEVAIGNSLEDRAKKWISRSNREIPVVLGITVTGKRGMATLELWQAKGEAEIKHRVKNTVILTPTSHPHFCDLEITDTWHTRRNFVTRKGIAAIRSLKLSCMAEILLLTHSHWERQVIRIYGSRLAHSCHVLKTQRTKKTT